jgi:hypothetical protein
MDPGWVCSITPILFIESAKSGTVIAATAANRRRFGHTDASPWSKGAKADALRFWRRGFRTILRILQDATKGDLYQCSVL